MKETSRAAARFARRDVRFASKVEFADSDRCPTIWHIDYLVYIVYTSGDSATVSMGERSIIFLDHPISFEDILSSREDKGEAEEEEEEEQEEQEQEKFQKED